jgi:hypothetical protein
LISGKEDAANNCGPKVVFGRRVRANAWQMLVVIIPLARNSWIASLIEFVALPVGSIPRR